MDLLCSELSAERRIFLSENVIQAKEKCSCSFCYLGMTSQQNSPPDNRVKCVNLLAVELDSFIHGNTSWRNSPNSTVHVLGWCGVFESDAQENIKLQILTKHLNLKMECGIIPPPPCPPRSKNSLQRSLPWTTLAWAFLILTCIQWFLWVRELSLSKVLKSIIGPHICLGTLHSLRCKNFNEMTKQILVFLNPTVSC